MTTKELVRAMKDKGATPWTSVECPDDFKPIENLKVGDKLRLKRGVGENEKIRKAIVASVLSEPVVVMEYGKSVERKDFTTMVFLEGFTGGGYVQEFACDSRIFERDED